MGFLAYFLAIVTVSCGLLEVAAGKPWPTYSLENMPRTSFSCRDKILGGYYADAETQCQMFHVCVKVAGVGVQDFRFLCPNGTAFDQEAQICADWGDVDCEAATLYYGSDNFDLYRISSGFESKRAPYAEEEEATFHLQRAETGDARRGKQVIVNQSKHAQTFGPNAFNRPAVTTKATTQQPQTTSSQQPQVNRNEFAYNANYYQGVSRASEYRPTSTTTTTTTTKPIPAASVFPETQRFSGNDEIFRGSHSSNFFNNRNNGKEDYENDFSSTPVTSTVKPRQASVRIRQRGRGGSRFSSTLNNISTSPEKAPSSTVASTKLASASVTAAPSSLPPYLRTQGSFSFTSRDTFRSTPQASPSASPQPAVVTYRPQQQHQPNFHPASSTSRPIVQETSTSREIFKIPASTPAYTTFTRQPAAQFNPQQNIRTSLEPQHSPNPLISYTAYNPEAKSRQSTDYFNEKTTLQQKSAVTPNFQIQTTQKPVQNLAQKDVVSFNFNNYQTAPEARTQLQPREKFAQDNKFNPHSNYDLTAVQQSKFTYNPYQTNKVGPLATSSPIPSSTTANFYSTPAPVQSSSPRGFTSAASILPVVTTPKPIVNYERYQTVNRNGDNYTPSTVKKFSTLVPKELYDPTTFKPTTYKKPVDAFAAIKAIQVEQAKTASPVQFNKFSAASYLPSTSTQGPTPKLEEDEDDGQYHPELYEKDFARYKIGQKRKSTKTSGANTAFQFGTNYQVTAATLPPPANSAEDEFLKTAHSQNIAASGNELRAEKEKARQQSTTKSATRTSNFSKAPTIPPNATSTKRPPQAAAIANDKDASYDYQYYDTYSGNPRDYSEYEIIEDFGKTKTKSKKH